MRKDRTDSPLAVLTEAQADELFVILQHMPYGRAVEWASEHLGVETSVAGLARWWGRQSKARMRAQIRRDIDTSAQFDRIADDSILDDRMRKALKDGFFRFMAADDNAAALEFAKMALQANQGGHNAAKLEISQQRIKQQEDAARLAREKFEAAERRIAATRSAIESLNQTGALTAEARQTIEKAMGML